MDLNTFMKHLQTYRAPRVFNPWREYEPGLDIGPAAPEIRYICLLRKAWAIREGVSPAWP